MDDDTRRQRPIDPEPPWPSFALPRGTTINGYRIERILGSGGFGITYLALDLLQQRFAVKEYYPKQFATRRDMTVQPTTVEDSPLFDECKDRFLREAQALVLLGRVADASDGIVRVRTYFEAFGTCFLVMDYVQGDSLADILRREPGGLSAPRVRSLLVQLLSSVRAVHQAGLVHRDIKPANIIVRDNDRVVLIDFGATRQATPSDVTSYTQIYSGGYGPPEQVLGLRQGEFSDIYAIGAVCYRAIGGSVVDSLARQNSLAAGRPDPLVAAATFGAGRYPLPMLSAIDAALAVDPARRPQNADAMLAILGPESGADREPAAAAVGGSVAASSGVRRGVWIAAVVAGAFAVGGIAYLVRSGPAPPRPVAEVHAPTPEPKPPSAPSAPASPAASADADQRATTEPPPPAPLAPGPQREAVVVPPITPPVPSPEPIPPSPFQRAQDAAGALPCAAVNVAAGKDGIRLSGFSAPGPELDQVLADVGGQGRVLDEISRVDQSACDLLAGVGPLVRRSWSDKSQLSIRLEQSSVPVGANVGISVATALPVLYLDVFQPDGSVRHLLRPGQSGITSRRATTWTASLPAGSRFIVAIGATAPLDIGTRPETERATEYLAGLRTRLANPPPVAAADLAMVIVRGAEPVVAKQPLQRPSHVRPEKCANIVSRAQLGETLSNAEIAALQTECRS